MQIQSASTDMLTRCQLAGLRRFLDAAYLGRFDDDDWAHALGGTHVWIEVGEAIVSHAALVERRLTCDGHDLRVGTVEAVATAHAYRRQGCATMVMRRIGDLIQERYPLRALSTGTPGFYRPLGWDVWRGNTFVGGPTGRVRTPDDDGGVLILTTARSPRLDPDGDIIADWRTGDVW